MKRLLLPLLLAASPALADLKPSVLVDHEHECKFSGGALLDPNDLSTNKYHGETLLEFTEDDAFKRYGDIPNSIEDIEKLGFKQTHKFDSLYLGEKIDNGELHTAEFSANMFIEFVKQVGNLKEKIYYGCKDVEVSKIPVDSKAILQGNILFYELIPTDFAPESYYQYKFDLVCFDDWDEVVFTHSKVRGSSTIEAMRYGEEEFMVFVPAISIDKNQNLLRGQLRSHKESIEFCELQNLQSRKDVKKEQQYKDKKEDANNLEDALTESIEANDKADKERDDQSKVNDVMTEIQSQIGRRWIRPPSTRSGDFVTLEVRLVPSGHIAKVTVIESNGSDALEKSIIKAVEKIGQFNKVKDLDSKLFEDNFRTFKIMFRPEDLRM